MSSKKKKQANAKGKLSATIALIIVWGIIMLLDYYSLLDNGNNIEPITIVNTATSSARVHFIDVGQGDSVLIETDSGSMLIDAGERNQGQVVINYIKSLGITELEYVIGTHPHSDHIGGLSDVILEFDIHNIILPNVEHSTATFERMIDAIIEKNLSITEPILGEKFYLGDATFTIIAPTQETYENLNNYSVGLKMDYAGKSFIFTGDAEELSEKEMIASGINLQAEVLKVGHHGSQTSTHQAFLDAVNPEIAVISLSADNSYGHPHEEVQKRLATAKIPVYRTDESGTIVIHISSNGELDVVSSY